MNLAETLREYIQACFTGLWIESHEHEDALAEIAQLCRDEDWRLATWDLDAGLTNGLPEVYVPTLPNSTVSCRRRLIRWSSG